MMLNCIEGFENVNEHNLIDLFESSGFINSIGVVYPNKLLDSLGKSDYVITAWDDERLVGLCNVLCDSVTAYIINMLVMKDYRYLGIGSKMLNMLFAKYKECRIQVTSSGSIRFFTDNGFIKENACILTNGGIFK